MADETCSGRYFHAHQGKKCVSKEEDAENYRVHSHCACKGELVQCKPTERGFGDGPWYLCQHVVPGHENDDAAREPLGNSQQHEHGLPPCDSLSPAYFDKNCGLVHPNIDEDSCVVVSSYPHSYCLCTWTPQ
jgi:hypothetical protein